MRRSSPLSPAEARAALHKAGGDVRVAARLLGVHRATIYRALKADHHPVKVEAQKPVGLTVEKPLDLVPIDKLLLRRSEQFRAKDRLERAQRLVPIQVTTPGPIGIVHFGDPHVDDDGTDIVALQEHIKIIQETEGCFAANIGDTSNNWIGRLAHLYSEQSTSAEEAWMLVDWFFREMKPYLLYVLAGNHGAWSGAGDPVRWMLNDMGTIYEPNGVRLELQFPNSAKVRVNARHDFPGTSQYNPTHGLARAATLGWRDHILVAGHLHISGYQTLKDPATGLIQHLLRVAGYKVHDRYAKTRGFPDQNISPAAMTIIDPAFPEDSPKHIMVFHDIAYGADFLGFLRRRSGHAGHGRRGRSRPND